MTDLEKAAMEFALRVLESSHKRGERIPRTYDIYNAIQQALDHIPDAGEMVEQQCPTCRGNDGDAPCAYPSEGKPGCLRDARMQPAQQEPVAWPADMLERIDAAIKRITSGHGLMRVPPDKTDPDLVLAEIRNLIKSSRPQAREPLTDEQIDQLLPEIVNGGTFTVITYGRAVARAIEAAHGITSGTATLGEKE